MRNIVLLSAAGGFLACIANAQTADEGAYVTDPRAAPFVEIGVSAGRVGPAFGSSVTFQANPFSKGFLGGTGFYVSPGMSSVSGYQAGDGILANLTGRILAFGMEYRAYALPWKFVVGGFGQAAYSGNRIRASYFDSDYGIAVEYRDSDKEPLFTFGTVVRRPIGRGGAAIFRIGKNFGETFASDHAGGFSISGGFAADAQKAGRNIGKGLKRFAKMFGE